MISLKIFVVMMNGCKGMKTIFNTRELLNVSYDSTRELYVAYNEKFKRHWEDDLGDDKITLKQSYGGWHKKFSDNSSPYTSTIVFLVRADNPKYIQD